MPQVTPDLGGKSWWLCFKHSFLLCPFYRLVVKSICCSRKSQLLSLSRVCSTPVVSSSSGPLEVAHPLCLYSRICSWGPLFWYKVASSCVRPEGPFILTTTVLVPQFTQFICSYICWSCQHLMAGMYIIWISSLSSQMRRSHDSRSSGPLG